MNSKQKQFKRVKQTFLIIAFIIAVLWLFQPFVYNKTALMPQNYYEFGVKCLHHFKENINDNEFKLMNTYAKRNSEKKDLVLIQVKNLHDEQQLQIECVFSGDELASLTVDGKKATLK